MKKYHLLKEETETHITWTKADNAARIYTLDPAIQRRINSIMKDYPEFCKIIRIDDCCGNPGITYSLPIKLINIRRPSPQRVLSEEQRAEMAERLKKIKAKANAD